MSQRALMLACRDQLQNIFGLDSDSIEVMFDGQVKPMCGELFLAVHPGSWAGQSGDHDLDEVFGCQVTVTRRLGEVPMDRWGPEVLAKANTGLEADCRAVVNAIHKQYLVMNSANAVYIPGTFAKFMEPLYFADGGHPEEKGPDWFSAADIPSTTGSKWPNAGVAQTIIFSRAHRIQQIFPQITIAPPTLYSAALSAYFALGAGQVGIAYSQSLTATGGRDDITDSYNFALAGGSLPTGLTMFAGGTLSGTPGAGTAGTYKFRISATDPVGLVGYQNYSLVVNP